MSQNIYYHNPRCSKSRQGLELLNESSIEFSIKEYLNEGFTKEELLEIFSLLNKKPLEVIRAKEAIFTELALDSLELSQDEWCELIVKNPILMERPIIKSQSKAIIGRPPTDLLKII